MTGLEPKKYFLRARDFWSRNRRNPFLYLALAVFVFQFALTLIQCRSLVDDAYISARYARNLAEGFGLVYNRGTDRVEGYSNFLWVLLLAFFWKIGFNMRFIAQALGVLCGLASSAALFFWVKKETGQKWLALGAAGLLASNLYFAIWNEAGLETPLFSLLVVSAIYALSLKRNLVATILCLLAALTRPDGVLLFGAVALVQVLDLGKGLGRAKDTIAKWPWFIVPYAVYFAGRAFYYHSFLPNTFYAKTGLGLTALREGAIYFGQLAIKEQGILVAVLLILPGIIRARKFSLAIAAGILFAVFYFLFVFLVGGDWMPDFRMLVPLFPLLYGLGAILFYLEIGPEKFRSRGKIFYAAFGIILALNIFQGARYSAFQSYDKTWHRNQGQFYMPAANWLRKYVWQNQTVALGDIGYIGYFGNHDRIIDTMGLVDRHLARLPGYASLTTDVDYVLDQKPFCIVTLVHKYPDGAELGHSEFDRQIVLDKRFGATYHLVTEIFGWDSQEVSRTDWKERTSKVYFHIYLANQS